MTLGPVNGHSVQLDPDDAPAPSQQRQPTVIGSTGPKDKGNDLLLKRS